MIPFNFIYYKPDTLSEAVSIFAQMRAAGKTPLYYGGGSEIITMSRAGSIHPGAVIDIKGIPELRALAPDGDGLIIGAACTLSDIKESKLFPLLGTAAGRIADHTNQCRITLGGNLCGTIIYRETSLPLMLADAQVFLYGPEGMRTEPFNTVFKNRMHIREGELIVHVHIPFWALNAPYVHIKHTAQEKIDYPLVNVTALRKDNKLRAAFSGICSYPFRSPQIESALNDQTLSADARIARIPELLPEPALSDAEGSGAYRLFVLKNTLLKLLEDWEHGAL